MNSFLKACREQNFEQVKALLHTDTISRKRLLRLTDDKGCNCLHFAVFNGDIECTRYLLAFKELDIGQKVKERSGSTAFHLTLRRQHLRTPYMVEHGRLAEEIEPTIEIIKMLFEVNNDVINWCDDCDRSPLQLVIIHRRHFDIVKLLIDLGSSVNHKDHTNHSVLHIAAAQRRIDVVRYLLQKTDCDVNAADDSGWLACCTFVQWLVMNYSLPSEQSKHIKFCAEFLWLFI